MESIDKLFDNFKSKIGTTIGQSEWININQNLINDFANLTMDNPVSYTHLTLPTTTPV